MINILTQVIGFVPFLRKIFFILQKTCIIKCISPMSNFVKTYKITKVAKHCMYLRWTKWLPSLCLCEFPFDGLLIGNSTWSSIVGDGLKGMTVSVQSVSKCAMNECWFISYTSVFPIIAWLTKIGTFIHVSRDVHVCIRYIRPWCKLMPNTFQNSMFLYISLFIIICISS